VYSGKRLRRDGESSAPGSRAIQKLFAHARSIFRRVRHVLLVSRPVQIDEGRDRADLGIRRSGRTFFDCARTIPQLKIKASNVAASGAAEKIESKRWILHAWDYAPVCAPRHGEAPQLAYKIQPAGRWTG